MLRAKGGIYTGVKWSDRFLDEDCMDVRRHYKSTLGQGSCVMYGGVGNKYLTQQEICGGAFVLHAGGYTAVLHQIPTGEITDE